MLIQTGPCSPRDALRFADELEQAIGEVANGRRKAGNLPLEPMARLIQFARDYGSLVSQLGLEASGASQVAQPHSQVEWHQPPDPTVTLLSNSADIGQHERQGVGQAAGPDQQEKGGSADIGKQP